MVVERREQVFISSTFIDLKEERQALIQTLLEADCFPAGMELFPAADTEKWELIKNVIDDSDYYIVVLGGRYGSTDAEGIGYTEKEFDYAVASHKPVMGFLHGNPGSIPLEKSEVMPEARKKLDAFREKIEQRIVKYWTSPDDLSGALALSLIKIRKQRPAVGWIRGDRALTPEVETEIAQLRERIATLSQELETKRAGTGDALSDEADLAQGSDVYKLALSIKYWEKGDTTSEYNSKWHFDYVDVTWDSIFGKLSPLMLDEATETQLDRELDALCSDVLPEQVANMEFPDDLGQYSAAAESQRGVIHEVMVQFFALGLAKNSDKRHGVNDNATYWTLTPKGRAYVTQLRAIRRGSKEVDLQVPAEDSDLSQTPE